jgi:hypothetical protein
MGNFVGKSDEIGQSDFPAGHVLIAVPIDVKPSDFSSDWTFEEWYVVCKRSSDDVCYMREYSLWRTIFQCGFDSKVASVKYAAAAVGVGSGVTPYALMVGLEREEVPGGVLVTPKVDASGLDECTGNSSSSKQLFASGYAMDISSVEAGLQFANAAIDREVIPGKGNVEFKYIDLDTLIARGDGGGVLLHENGRRDFITQSGGFVAMNYSSSDLVSYNCVEDDKVRAFVLGVDVFTTQVITMILVAIGLFWLLAYVSR